MDFAQLLQQRYTTKHYDASRKVPEEVIDQILDCVRLTPTSCNSQPYHFYVLTGKSKERLREAIMDFNLKRYDGASHAVVISSKSTIDEPHLQQVLAAEEAAGRLPNPEIKQAQDTSRHYFSKLHLDYGDFPYWTGKQAYIAFATMVYAAENYGVDSTALEGIDYLKVDSLLDLAARNETCQLIVLLGYRDPNDSNMVDRRPKSRLSREQLVTRLD